MLENVINNPDEPEGAAANEEIAIDAIASSPERSTFTVDPESASVDTNASSPEDSSPHLSPSNPDNAKILLQLQEENQKLADAKLSAQLRYWKHIPTVILFVILVIPTVILFVILLKNLLLPQSILSQTSFPHACGQGVNAEITSVPQIGRMP